MIFNVRYFKENRLEARINPFFKKKKTKKKKKKKKHLVCLDKLNLQFKTEYIKRL